MSYPLFRRIFKPSKNILISGLHQDLNILRKQLLYKSNNMGIKELDIILGNWARENLSNLSKEECCEFYEEVLQMETPDLLRLFTIKSLSDEENQFLAQSKFIASIKNKLLK